MTNILTPLEVAGWWQQAGGNWNMAAEWVAIAMAESSLDADAVSVTGAIGLWQIEPYNSTWYPGPASGLFRPQINADAAFYGSGSGGNCAAWDTCYADIARSGRYTYLAGPEVGSAAYNNMTAAYNAIGSGGRTGAGGGTGPQDVGDADHIWSALTFDVSVAIPGFVRDIQITTASIAPIYGPGWR
jgi:hypothetical protein